MAPERFSTDEIHPSSDIYALACVLYQCLTGQQPFPGNTLEQIASRPHGHPTAAAFRDARSIPSGDGRGDRHRAGQTTRRALPHSSRNGFRGKRSRHPGRVNPVARRHRHRHRRRESTPSRAKLAGATVDPGRADSLLHRRRRRNSAGPIRSHRRICGRRDRRAAEAVGRHTTVCWSARGVRRDPARGRPVSSPSYELTQRDDSGSAKHPRPRLPVGSSSAATIAVDYGPGTDLSDKPVPNAPATTSNWAVRSTVRCRRVCGDGGEQSATAVSLWCRI